MNNYEDNKAKHNVYAQAFLDNSKKLLQMAEIVSSGFENARANEQTYGSRESGARLSKVEGDEKKRIKIQLHNAIPILEKMDSVVEIKRTTDSFISKEDLKKDIKELFVDDWIIRDDGLEIEFSQKLVNRAISKYVFTPAERIATYAAPYVIKYGKKIYSEDNHKGNGHPSITFGAPVEIDGVKGYMGVAVLQTTANRYRSHRIISTDDTVFEIIMENVEATGAGNNSPKAVARPAITSTFDIIIPQSAQNSNTSEKNSLEGRKSKDDTIYDIDLLLDNDEDLQDTIRRNPQAAVELIYLNAVDYMQKSFESAGDVVLTDKEIADIAKNMFLSHSIF